MKTWPLSATLVGGLSLAAVLRASQRGEFNVYATLDKIQSNTITVVLGEP